MSIDKLAIEGGTPVRDDFAPMGKSYELIGEKEKQAVMEVLESKSLFRYYGPNLLNKVAEFESNASALLKTPHALATSSGTASLRCCLAALGVGCGDEVIIPACTFIASVNAVVLAGAVPVFAEINETLGLDPEDLKRKISSKTAAIMPVHLENGPCEMDRIVAIAKQRNIPIIEDSCQAFGASYHGKNLGTFGDISAFSLQLEKNITSGEGGLVISADKQLITRAACFHDQGGMFITRHGRRGGLGADDAFVGENLRMTEIAGAIANVQLQRFPELQKAQRKNHRYVMSELKDVDSITLRRQPDPEGDGGSTLVFYLPDRRYTARFVQAMISENVFAFQLYGGWPVYLAPSIRNRRTASGKGGPWNCTAHPTDIRYEPGLCPRSEDLAARTVLVPVGSRFSEYDCDMLVRAVRKVSHHFYSSQLTSSVPASAPAHAM